MILRQNQKITFCTIIISAIAWFLLLFNPGHLLGAENCHMSYSGGATFKMFWEMHPLSNQLFSWLVMVLAMMMPKLIIPIQYICYQSLKRNRFINAFLFFLGYLLDWMMAGVLMVLIIDLSRFFMPDSYIPALLMLGIAVIWQFSPLKQKFINLGHQHDAIATFGIKSQTDSLLFGVKHGLWCVGSGWALMIFPMLLPHGHNMAMFIITFMMISEHLEYPQEPRWKVDGHFKLLSIVNAQIKFRVFPFIKNAF